MIAEFNGKYRFLSNFYPCIVQYEGVLYPTVEHAYQAAKTLDASDREAIRKCRKAGDAKRVGRHVQLRPDWETVKVDTMRGLLWMKFTSTAMTELLLATGDEELLEGNWWDDTFWGVCRGKGENHLGKLLMEIREQLR